MIKFAYCLQIQKNTDKYNIKVQYIFKFVKNYQYVDIKYIMYFIRKNPRKNLIKIKNLFL